MVANYVIYNGELYHYGVKGMKWGVRKALQSEADRYSARSQKHASKVEKSRTRLGKNYQNYRSFNAEANANIYRSLANDKGIRKTVSNLAGHGYGASVSKANANYWDRKASYSKTRYGKTVNKARSFNAQQMAKYHEKQKNAKSIGEYGKNVVDLYMNTPVKTWSGRTVTKGQAVVERFLGIDTFQDIRYYQNSKKKSR